MTPFMARVADVIDNPQAMPPLPVTRPSVPKPVSAGLKEHLAIRFAAGQLVSEANAVLAGHGEQILLDDEFIERQLGFSLRYRHSYSRVVIRLTRGRDVIAQLLGDGVGTCGPRELTGPEELERLILLLLGSGHEARSAA